ncbi:hypothetical protein B0H19DRAFT_87523 [Mycena capillaripes]|nr:hypothetical protein B0H19DRAFT_87523 [Mycena capillaripes]
MRSSAAATISDLPSELTDQILDYVVVKKVRDNLASCSLVCRQWTHRSRFHFFSDCRLLLHYHNACAFAELLRSPHCTILPHVQQLTMVNNGDCHLAFDAIKEELGLLVNVESLKFSGTSWAVHGAAPKRGFMSSLPNVVELEIDCPNVGDFDHALMIICAFPSLRRLSVRQFSIAGQHQPLPPYPPYTPPAYLSPPLVSRLAISAPTLIPLLHWFNSAASQCVTRLEISVSADALKPEHIPPLLRYLRSLSHSLEDLKFVFLDYPRILAPSVFQELSDLGHLKNLRTLHVECRDVALDWLEATEVFCQLGLWLVLPIIQTIKSSIFERVCFVFEDRGMCSSLQSRVLDQLFSEHFPHLKGVRLSGTGIDSDFESLLRRLFPRINARGLLEITSLDRLPTGRT